MTLPTLGARSRFLWSMFLSSALCLALAGPPAAQGKQAEDSEPAAEESFPVAKPRAAPRQKLGSAALSAVSAAFNGDPWTAAKLAQDSRDPAAVKLVEWLNVTENWKAVGYDRIMAFIAVNPQWPSIELLNQRAEWLLYSGSPDPDRVIKHFAGRKPASAEGRIALARALIARGDKKAATAHIVAAWYDVPLSAAAKRTIRSEFGSMLTREHLEGRLWRLIHAQRMNEAIEAAKLISADHVQAAKVAAELMRERKAGPGLYKKLPASLRNQRAMLYALARYYRRTDKIDQARDILLKAPSNHAALIDPEAWWIERRLIVRQSVGPHNKKYWPAAYKIAAAHGFSDGNNHSEGEFLAGWIALRMLNDPKTAAKHFSSIAPRAKTRTEKSRGDYWAGRAWQALGDKAKAEAAFQAAAQSPTLYYGQLAREALGLGGKPVPINTGNPTPAVRAAVEKDELVRAFRMLADAGAQGHLWVFLRPLAARFQKPDEAAAVAGVVHSVAGTFMTVRFAKAASAYGVDIDDWGYPSGVLPNWKRLGNPVEKAMILGLTRQESEFHHQAGSQAGARGLMQLMPGTAKLIARQYKVKYNEKQLTDPAYNVMLGAAHLGDLVANYRGSYILTLVAYNAGPRRVTEWIERYGDPRSANVDAIDWIEMVPFTETRQYIQKVLQNVHVYRSRIAPKTALPMTADLARGGGPSAPAQAVAEDEEKGCGVTKATLVSLFKSC